MTKINGSTEMIQAIDRSIDAKRTALVSRHLPEDIRIQIESDISLIERAKQIIYRSMDNQPLFV